MTGRQIVDADQDDHVQDEHLTQEHDFHLETIGTEELSTRSSHGTGNVAVHVRSVFFFDGIGHRYRLVRHRPNDASNGA